VKNRISALRSNLGITQKQLADAAGTSQQQIQRIESGNQSIRFDLAMRICAALHAPVEHVFPASKPVVRKLRRKGGTGADLLQDDGLKKGMEQAGFDMDPEIWFFKCRLRGGAERTYRVSGPDKHRLWDAVQRVEPTKFVVFDSPSERIILNLDHLLFCHFLFEAPILLPEEGTETSENLQVLLAGECQFLRFEIDFDQLRTGEAEEENLGELASLVANAEVLTEEDEVLAFTDMDGETAFFRASDTALIEIPLWALEPEILSDEPEDEGEQRPAEKNTP
jgi:transcriptional regulator with XRE-family HTH domain